MENKETPNAEQLRALMTQNGLSRMQVADIMAVGKSTVDSWLAPASANCHRPLTDKKLRLFKKLVKADHEN